MLFRSNQEDYLRNPHKIPQQKTTVYFIFSLPAAVKVAAGLMNLMTSGEVRAGIVTGSSQVLCHTDRIAGFCDRISACYPRIRVIAEIENSDDDFESYDKGMVKERQGKCVMILYHSPLCVLACTGTQNRIKEEI